MKRLDMQSTDRVDENVKRIGALFPNCVVERKNEDGQLEYAIDFDLLRQELSRVVVEGPQERYQFTWPDKRKAILAANAPISDTLRPCREESVDFDTTENLYIEGDNLAVLKLLQETYMGKVKMIYIDPPYNTGSDAFTYDDDFAISTDEYAVRSGRYDGEGNLLFDMHTNGESNGRFHTDWLNMMYSRLKLARDLLTDDGVIFISIDDNEQSNLKKICDEIFGIDNFEGILIWKTKTAAKGVPTKNMLVTNHDYILVYSKSKKFRFRGEDRCLESFNNPDNDPRGPWKADNMKSTVSTNVFTITDPATGHTYTKNWAFSPATIEQMIRENKIIWPNDPSGTPRQKRFLCEMTNETTPLRTLIGEFQSETATNRLKELFDEIKIFDFSKHIELLKLLIKQANVGNGLILDFFSGSATTAHAVMQLNAEDGGHRKFIMVQLPEACDPKSEAYKAGYRTICDIGKERIRRAGKKILAEQGLVAQGLDVGFRVLKLASSNMQDVFYTPDEYTYDLLSALEDNIKPDRTPEDLLFQVMLDLGVLLSSKIEVTTIAGKKVFNVADGYLMACFDTDVTEEVVTVIAKQKPYYFVMRDSSMASDSMATNFDQIFVTYSPDTVRRVL